LTIIELSEEQFRKYSSIHTNRSYFQTVEFTNMYKNNGYENIYIGLIDENNNLHAATTLLINKVKNYKYAYAPRGFLIDYSNYELFKTFTELLKRYLKKIKIVFVKIDPYIPYQIYDKNLNMLNKYGSIMASFNSLGYLHLGFNNNFESINSRFEIKVDHYESIEDAYSKLDRKIKRKLRENNKMNITIHKTDDEEVKKLFTFIKDESKLSYISDLANFMTTNDNKLEAYYAKLNTKNYVNNYRYLLQEEMKVNSKLNNKVKDSGANVNEKLLKMKMLSDHLLKKYEKEIVKATNLYKNYADGIIVGVSFIIRNNKEIYFLANGYLDNLKEIDASYLLKWEIIKKYINEGYKSFNLGEISGNFSYENNPYFGLYYSKSGFGGNIYEYPGEFDLVVNKAIYKIFYNVMHYESKIKK